MKTGCHERGPSNPQSAPRQRGAVRANQSCQPSPPLAPSVSLMFANDHLRPPRSPAPSSEINPRSGVSIARQRDGPDGTNLRFPAGLPRAGRFHLGRPISHTVSRALTPFCGDWECQAGEELTGAVPARLSANSLSRPWAAASSSPWRAARKQRKPRAESLGWDHQGVRNVGQRTHGREVPGKANVENYNLTPRAGPQSRASGRATRTSPWDHRFGRTQFGVRIRPLAAPSP